MNRIQIMDTMHLVNRLFAGKSTYEAYTLGYIRNSNKSAKVSNQIRLTMQSSNSSYHITWIFIVLFVVCLIFYIFVLLFILQMKKTYGIGFERRDGFRIKNSIVVAL